MPRKKSKAVPDGNGLVSQDTLSGLLGGTTVEGLRRIMSEVLDKSFDECYGLRSE